MMKKMDWKTLVSLLQLLTVLMHSLVSAQSPKSAIHSCNVVSGTPASVRIFFRIVKNDDPVNSVYAFDPVDPMDTTSSANRDTDADCIKTGNPIDYDVVVDTTTDGTYKCKATVTEDAGVKVVSMLFRVYAYSDSILSVDDDAYVIRCRADDLTGAAITTPTVEFGDSGIITSQEPQTGAYMTLLDPDSYPVTIAALGDSLSLSVEFFPESSVGPDSFGTRFYIGFLGNDFVTTSDPRLFVIIKPRYPYKADVTITTVVDTVTVSIDPGMFYKHEVSEEFIGCAEDGAPEKAFIGIEINSHQIEVGVLVCNFDDESSDCYSALPVDVTGTKYYPSSLMGVNEVAEFMIIAHENATEVTITVPAASGHTAIAAPISLDKFEAYHYSVSTDNADTSHVNGYFIESTKDVSVITGNRHSSGDHLETQIAPVEIYGDRYVLVAVDPSNDGRLTKYIIQATYDAGDTAVTQYGSGFTITHTITTSKYPPLMIDVARDNDCELHSTHPIIVTQVVLPTGTDDGFGPSMLIMPSVRQWAPSYSLKYDESAAVTGLLVFKSSDDLSKFTFNGASVVISSSVTVSGPNNYVVGEIAIPDVELTLSLQDKVTTFMPLLYAYDATTATDSKTCIGFMPQGTRFAPNDECYKVGKRGDGRDNDCDGSIDEELADGLDNDGDGSIDEDTIASTTAGAALAIRPVNCKVSGDPTFPDSELTLQMTGSDGCAVERVGPFSLDAEFAPGTKDNYGTGTEPKILVSGQFSVGKFLQSSTLHFSCDVGSYCYADDDTTCLDICDPAVRKREIGDDKLDNITTSVPVLPYSRNIGQKPCPGGSYTIKNVDLNDCFDNSYIQMMVSALSVVAFLSLLSACSFCFLFRRRRNGDKNENSSYYHSNYHTKSF